ncbi:MAG: flavodoxin family protein [Synergistaceae bacterium]|nr:flavodoxin family protein [Synergistaceae bacterium]
MKILVLNGSPKREKSDTMHITRAFLDGMNEASPQDARIVNVIDKHIEYCTGCFTCMRNGGSCVHDDDMREILNEILASGLLLFSYPLYCYGMPAPLKAMMDRTLPLSSMAMRKTDDGYEHVEQADFSRLKYVMICGCGFPNSKHNFEPAVESFKRMFPNNHTMITVPESPMFNAPEAAAVTGPRLELVRRAGRQYAETGAIDDKLMAEICSPMIPEEQYAKIVNGEVKP